MLVGDCVRAIPLHVPKEQSLTVGFLSTQVLILFIYVNCIDLKFYYKNKRKRAQSLQHIRFHYKVETQHVEEFQQKGAKLIPNLFFPLFTITWLIEILKKKTKRIDRDRTRTCNPQIRSLVPYPLGHTVSATGVRLPVDYPE